MAKPIKKAKVKELAKVEGPMEIFKRQTEARRKIAQAAYDAQDRDTRAVIDAICDRLSVISTGNAVVYPEGKGNSPGVLVRVPAELTDANILFFATEILKDLAMMDVRVANYEFPTVYCAECQEKLTTKKRKKVKK